MQLLILLVVIVGIVAIGQLAKVYELSSRISGRREEDISHADTRLNANLFLVFVTVFFASTAYLYWAYGDYAPPAASEHGVAVDTLMSFNIWIITAVFVLVNAALMAMKRRAPEAAFRVPMAVPVFGLGASLLALSVSLAGAV